MDRTVRSQSARYRTPGRCHRLITYDQGAWKGGGTLWLGGRAGLCTYSEAYDLLLEDSFPVLPDLCFRSPVRGGGH